MNNGWPKHPIGEICDLVNGGTPNTGVPIFWGGEHQWITPAEMGRRNTPYVSETARTLTDLGLANSSARPLPPYSVILSSRAPIGHLVINTQPMVFNQGCKGLVPRASVDYKYLYYYLRSIVELLNALGTGTTFKELSGAKLKEILVPLPPLAEQQRIVGILDEAFDGIAIAKASTEKNLQNIRSLFESHLESVFSQGGTEWVNKPLADLCDIKHGFTFKSEYFTTQGNYVLLTPGNFYESGGYRDRGDKQKYYSGPIPSGFVLAKGDLLVAMTEQAAGLLGSPIIVPESDKFLHNQRLGLVVKKIGIPWTNEFFFYVFNRQMVRKKIHDSASGVKVRHTSPTKIGNVLVSFPTSLSEQHRIVVRVKELEYETQRLESIYERKLSALEELKKSLLHHAFTGQLTAEKSTRSNSVVVPFPTGLSNISTTDLHAGVLAMAYQLHEQNGKLQHFTHVKAEKIAHMVEAHLGINLGRAPVKDAAGPNDFPHLHKVEHRARKANYFDFKQVPGAPYKLQKLGGFDRLIERTRGALGHHREAVETLLHWMLRLTAKQAEIVATVFAAWNNLLLHGKQPSDEQIVRESREDWHPNKLIIKREKFFSAVQWLREQGVVPEGKGRYVDKPRN